MVGYLCVLLVAAVDLGDALLGAFSGGRGGEGLLHPAGSFPQTALDAEGLIQLIYLRAQTHTHTTLLPHTVPPAFINKPLLRENNANFHIHKVLQ